MRRGADAADARGDLRHVLRGPAFGELLEAPQLGHLEKGALHLSLLVQKDVDLAVPFQARDGIDGDSASGCVLNGHRKLPPFSSSRAEKPAGRNGRKCPRIGDGFEGLQDRLVILGGHERGHAGQRLGAEILHPAGGTETAGAGHVALDAPRPAASPGGRPQAEQALGQQAFLVVDQDLVRALELLDLQLVRLGVLARDIRRTAPGPARAPSLWGAVSR